MYLDSRLSAKHSIMHTLTPRAKYIREQPMRAIFLLDIVKNGGPELSKYLFGKVGVSFFIICFLFSFFILQSVLLQCGS